MQHIFAHKEKQKYRGGGIPNRKECLASEERPGEETHFYLKREVSTKAFNDPK